MDADSRHNRRHHDPDVAERSSSAPLPRALRREDGEIRHNDRPHDNGHAQPSDDSEGRAMDSRQPRYAFTGMDDLPPRDDDDELITVGEPIYDVVKVSVTDPLTLAIEFEDGLAGTVRFADSYLTGSFAKLRDPQYFARVGIAHGAVSWPNEEPDMAPDTMYDAIKAHGEWVLR